MTDTDAITNALIRNGRAMVQVVEGLEVLKENAGSWGETLLINLTHDLYENRLKKALVSVPRDVREEILMAGTSEKRD